MRTASSASSRPSVLLTGFDPFGDTGHSSLPLNPSWLAVQALGGKRIGGHRLVAAQLPTVFGDSVTELVRLMALHKPALVICVGQAGGRAEVSIERVAINVDDGRICDNAGCQPIDVPIVPGGPAAYFATLPIKAMVRDLRAAGLPAAVSNTAGTFVCNHLFYGLMHALAPMPGLRGGFIHIPYLPEQAARFPGVPSLPLDRLVAALRIAVATALTVRDDVRETGGQLH
jgi:pyroglutamyl-peptidase